MLKGSTIQQTVHRGGINPDELPQHHLWWNGPDWLQNADSSVIPELSEEEIKILSNGRKENRQCKHCAGICKQEPYLLHNYSSLISS